MLEVLVSVVVLGLVVTASLKLVALSQKGLAAVRDKEEMIDECARLQVLLTIDPLDTFGMSQDLEWNVTDREEPLWVDDRIEFGFEDEELLAQKDQMKEQKLRWRELDIKYKNRSMIVFLPWSEEAAARSADSVSDILGQNK